MNLITKEKQTHRLREQIHGYEGEELGGGIVRVLGLTCTYCYI